MLTPVNKPFETIVGKDLATLSVLYTLLKQEKETLLVIRKFYPGPQHPQRLSCIQSLMEEIENSICQSQLPETKRIKKNPEEIELCKSINRLYQDIRYIVRERPTNWKKILFKTDTEGLRNILNKKDYFGKPSWCQDYLSRVEEDYCSILNAMGASEYLDFLRALYRDLEDNLAANDIPGVRQTMQRYQEKLTIWKKDNPDLSEICSIDLLPMEGNPDIEFFMKSLLEHIESKKMDQELGFEELDYLRVDYATIKYLWIRDYSATVIELEKIIRQIYGNVVMDYRLKQSLIFFMNEIQRFLKPLEKRLTLWQHRYGVTEKAMKALKEWEWRPGILKAEYSSLFKDRASKVNQWLHCYRKAFFLCKRGQAALKLLNKRKVSICVMSQVRERVRSMSNGQ